MDTGDIIAVSSILVGIFLATIVLVWQMRMQSNRFSEDIKEQGNRFSDELKEQVNILSDDIMEHGGRISDVEREQARLEGANGTLSEILKQQSHTHEPNDD